jgi:outer membrane protein TolC
MSKRFILITIYAMACVIAKAQTSLEYYLSHAVDNSPQIKQLLNEKEIHTLEAERLRAVYKGANVSLNGNLLIVPIISQDNGKTKLDWNAQNADRYYGYDLGQANSSLYFGATWTKPLLGNASYNAEKERLNIEKCISDNSMKLSIHDIKKAVTDQYILCLMDKSQMKLAENIIGSLKTQYNIMCRLAADGLVKNSDLQLLNIECNNNEYMREGAMQSYHLHRAELDIMCGISDSTHNDLEDIHITPEIEGDGISPFFEKYRLDSLHTVSVFRSGMIKYRPRLNLYVDGGVNTTDFNNTYRRIGASAGVSFSWLLFDGRQKRNLQRQTDVELRTIKDYQDRFMADRIRNRNKYIQQIKDMDTQDAKLKRQITDYDTLIDNYTRLMKHGELSVISYVTVLRNRMQVAQEEMKITANRELLINALNYWNW